MTDSLPLVTVGITCFNAQDTIKRAMNSALQQTYPNLEIIVVDDASDDLSVKTIEAYAKEGKEGIVLYKHLENKGAPSAYNTIIHQSSGKYICFFDDDDFSHADRVQKTVELLEQNNEEEALCYCDRFIQQPNEKSIIKGLLQTKVTARSAMEHMMDTLCYQYNRPYYRANQHKFTALKQHGLSGSSAGTGIMTAPKALLERYAFDEKMYRFCDTELNLRIFADGVQALNVSEPLMTQYPSEGSEKTAAIEKECLFYALQKHQDTFLKYGVTYPGIISLDDSFGYAQTKNSIDDQPLVSIGIILNKDDERGYEVIQSALNQTHQNREIIVVDNANTQESIELLERLNACNISVIRNENECKVSDCLNQLVGQAKGDFTVFFGNDDIAINQRVEKQLASLKAAEGNAVSVVNYNNTKRRYFSIKRVFGELGEKISAQTLKAFAWHVALQPSHCTYLLDGRLIPFHYYDAAYELLMGKTEIFKNIPFSSDFQTLQTVDFLLRFADERGTLVCIREPLIDKSKTNICDSFSEINALISKQSKSIESLFNVSAESLVARNALKGKLMNRFLKIKRFI